MINLILTRALGLALCLMAWAYKTGLLPNDEPWHWCQYRWLAHWLLGSGEPRHAPQEMVERSLTPYTLAVIEDAAPDGAQVGFNDPGGKVVGTMTLAAVKGRIVGVDRYDWHPDDPNDLICIETGDDDGWLCIETEYDKRLQIPAQIFCKLVPGGLARLDDDLYGGTPHIVICDALWPKLAGRDFDTHVDVPQLKLREAVYAQWRKTHPACPLHKGGSW